MKFSADFKLTFLRALTLLVPIFLLCSCGDDDDDDDIIWDMAPVNVVVNIQDAAGNNLLSPSVPGNLQGKKIVAEYQGEEYELNWDASDRTRYYMPFFSGLTLQSGYTLSGDHLVPDQNKNYLSFGEFDGADNQDISISLHIEGYTDSWDITVSHRIKWKGNTPHVTNTATLNGKNIPYDKIIITL
ncbi:MAG: hypothetical protein K2K81_10150 [Muribaculaceae bacterium]|nr:hypothetical protein [Muribaculaceae bacterium]